jgi:acetolactate decarboxylase
MTRSHHRLVPLVALVSQSIKEALADRAEQTGQSVDHIVRSALAEYLGLQHGTLFQVSNGGALVEGLYRGEMTVGVLRGYGDHGVGTFDGLDGEMVVVDGRVFQIRSSGEVVEADDATRTPFALVTRFQPEIVGHIASCKSYGNLQRQLDAWRPSDRDFYAIRIEARFAEIVSRPVRPATEGSPLTEAIPNQGATRATDVSGVLVGFWSPMFVTALTVPGYHLHFLDAERRWGGHLFDVQGSDLRVGIQRLADFRVCLPETAEFLAADLRADPAAGGSEAGERPSDT